MLLAVCVSQQATAVQLLAAAQEEHTGRVCDAAKEGSGRVPPRQTAAV